MGEGKGQDPGQTLSDGELAQAAGGARREPRQITQIACAKCGEMNIFHAPSPGICINCGEVIHFG